MATAIGISVRIKSSQLLNDPSGVIDHFIKSEALEKFETRIRQGKRRPPNLGTRRNTITSTTEGLTLTALSTLRRPRYTGKSWARKNIAIIKSMAPRVMNALARRLAFAAASREGWR
jgi:hypothetical protein